MTYLGFFLAAALAFGLGLLYIVFKGSKRGVTERLNKKVVQQKWQEVETMMSQGGPSNFQSAVMEADKLLDYCLKSLVGTQNNQNMSERLKMAQKKFSDRNVYQDVWSAHKVRNQLVHEVHHELNSAVARKTIEQFKKGLKNIGAL